MENSSSNDLKRKLKELLCEHAKTCTTEEKRKIVKMFLDIKLSEILEFCDVLEIENLQGKITSPKNQKIYHFSFMKEENLN